MKNTSGKAYAMNAFTPIKPKTKWVNELVMWYAAKGIGPNSASDLKKLSFIHFARWVVVPRSAFPHFPGKNQPREKMNYDYLFFESNFNGTWDQYIDAFSDVLPTGLNILWFWSVRYPGSVPITPFKNYIINNQIWTDYYFNATPGAATNDVKAGLHFREALARFRKRTEKMSDDEFKQAYEGFLAEVQSDLGETGVGPQLTLSRRSNVKISRGSPNA